MKISFLAFLFSFALQSGASTGESHSEPKNVDKEKYEIGDEEDTSVDALSHIQDSHDWHFFTIDGHHYSLPLPVILYSSEKGLVTFMSSKFHHEGELIEQHGHEYWKYNGYLMDTHGIHIYPVDENVNIYDFSITKNVVTLFISVIILFVVFLAVKAGYKKNKGKAPKGIQSLFEPIIIFIRDDVAKGNIGHKYERFMPFLLTIFFFIWFNNLMGLLPGAANLTGNISVTLTLAVFTLIITIMNGGSVYWKHIFDPLGKSMSTAAKIPLYTVLVPVEFLGIITKPFSLMVRLFANISAGHIIILSILGLTFMAQSYAVGVVSALFATVMNMLELFVAILQAYIFTLLSAMYIGQAVEEHH